MDQGYSASNDTCSARQQAELRDIAADDTITIIDMTSLRSDVVFITYLSIQTASASGLTSNPIRGAKLGRDWMIDWKLKRGEGI